MKLIILTKSKKYYEYCVAGVECDTGKKIRLISDDEEIAGALTDEDLQAYNGNVKCLDIVDVEIVEHIDNIYQKENYLIDRKRKMTIISNIDIIELFDTYNDENYEYIFFDNNRSFSPIMYNLDHSIQLNKVYNVSISKTTDLCGKTKTRMSFSYKNRFYHDISVTDYFFVNSDNNVHFNEAIVVFSFAYFDKMNIIYKIAAAIYPIK